MFLFMLYMGYVTFRYLDYGELNWKKQAEGLLENVET